MSGTCCVPSAPVSTDGCFCPGTFPEIPFLLGHRLGLALFLCESALAGCFYNPLGTNIHGVVIHFRLSHFYFYKSQGCDHPLFAKCTPPPWGLTAKWVSWAPQPPSSPVLHSRGVPSQPITHLLYLKHLSL